MKELKVGSTMPLNQAMGIEEKKCLDILVDEFNADGGIKIKGETYRINMIVYDDKYTADGGRAAVEKLVNEDKVKFLVSQLGSAPVLGGLPIAEDNKIPTIPYAVSDKIASPQFKYTYRQAGVGGHNWIYIKKAYRNLKTMVAFVMDDETGHYSAAAQASAGKAYMGITVLPPVYFPRDTVDFAPFATKIKNLNPDLVSFWGGLPGTQLGLQLKALYEMGWRGVKTMSNINLSEILSVCPKEAVEGLLFSYGDPTEFANPTKAALRLKAGYVKKYSKWDYTGSSLVDPFVVFVQMLKKADSFDPAAIQAAVKGLQVQGIAGKEMFMKRPDLGNDRVCDTMKEVAVGVIKDGKTTWPGLATLDDVKVFQERVYDCKGKWGY
jgi:branched-chain amino acid transport system substrate-binding protein